MSGRILPARLARLRRTALRRADALVLTHLPNLLYLVRFRGSSGVLVLTRSHCVFFTHGIYRTQARQEVVGAQIKIVEGDPLPGASRWLARKRPRRVAYEADHLSAAGFHQLAHILGANVELQATELCVDQLRAVKDADEIARIRAGVELTARVFEEILPLVRPGVRELDLAAEIEYRMKQHGARSQSFETIVASGARSALPHGRASRKRLRKNELVMFDLGAILADYCSDMTRTVFLGKPPAKVLRIYRAVQDALAAAREVVRAGVEASRVDAAARRVLAKRSLGRYFVHGTGHGVGLEIHEEPRLGRGSPARLKAGNVITLEPGVYLPGVGGVRIEDVVVVRKTGAETLTPLGTELICL